jgi:hypothetical protein
VVARHPVDATLREPRTPENVASAYDQTDFHALTGQLVYLASNAPDGFGIDTVITFSHQRLTAQLQENPAIDQFIFAHNYLLTISCRTFLSKFITLTLFVPAVITR